MTTAAQRRRTGRLHTARHLNDLDANLRDIEAWGARIGLTDDDAALTAALFILTTRGVPAGGDSARSGVPALIGLGITPSYQGIRDAMRGTQQPEQATIGPGSRRLARPGAPVPGVVEG